MGKSMSTVYRHSCLFLKHIDPCVVSNRAEACNIGQIRSLPTREAPSRLFFVAIFSGRLPLARQPSRRWSSVFLVWTSSTPPQCAAPRLHCCLGYRKMAIDLERSDREVPETKPSSKLVSWYEKSLFAFGLLFCFCCVTDFDHGSCSMEVLQPIRRCILSFASVLHFLWPHPDHQPSTWRRH